MRTLKGSFFDNIFASDASAKDSCSCKFLHIILATNSVYDCLPLLSYVHDIISDSASICLRLLQYCCRNWEMKSSRLLISRIRLWKNISGSLSNRLDSWKRHTNQEIGGYGWQLTGDIGWRLGGGTLRSLGDAWSNLQRRRHWVGRPHSLISASWILIRIYYLDDIIDLSGRQMGQVLWVEIDGAYTASFSLPWGLRGVVLGLLVGRCCSHIVLGVVAEVGNLRVSWRLVHGDIIMDYFE
ncbi:uncharacterized protein LOC111052196 [Nilaparvata lugens]|uniref:uncharacterized protein LOC111052196 n=1 Tax=Nilaparvata lugens TaxID=108931 RepID=UPI00193CFA30|nr:uncharacterized protein LOC111052196 [Nilaparvata lugens]